MAKGSAKRGEAIDTLYDAAAAFLEGSGFKPVVIGGTVIQRCVDAASDYHNELVIKFLGGKREAHACGDPDCAVPHPPKHKKPPRAAKRPAARMRGNKEGG